MKYFSFLFRQTASMMLLPLSMLCSHAQTGKEIFDHLKIFRFHQRYYDNVIDTAGNILFEENWNILYRAEECGRFFGIKTLHDSTRVHPGQFDGIPSVFALLAPDGTRTLLPYLEVSTLHKGHIPVRTARGWGIVDCRQNWIIEPSLEEAPILYDRHILLPEYRVDTLTKPYPSHWRYVGLADYSGRILAPAEYTDIHALDWWKKTYFVLMKNDRSSLINDAGEVIIPMGDYYIFPSISDESVWVISDSIRKVYYPATDTWVTENLDELTRGWYGCHEGFAVDLDADRYEWMNWTNPDGSIRLYASPEHVRISSAFPFLRIRKDGKYGVVSRSGRTILPCIYDNIFQAYPPGHVENYWKQCVFEGIISVELNGGWGLIDTSGNYLTHLIYDGLQGVSEGIVAAKVDGKTGFIDVHGNKIIPCVFDWTDEPWKNGIGTAYLVESRFLVNRQAEILISEMGEEGPASLEELRPPEPLTSLEERFRELLDEAGGFPDEVTWVNLGGAGLTSVPLQIKQFGNLEILDLPDNYISRISFGLEGFKDLEHVDLSNNSFEQFPQELLDIKALSILLMEENELEYLSKKIFEHPGLTELHLAGNRIETLPDSLPVNRDLESLGLEDNGIRSLPPSLSNLSALRYLYLSDNRITELPPEIGRMKNLVFLILDGNRLENLPEDLSGLKSLHTIDLSNNRLRTLPESLLGLRGLKQLRIEGNPIPVEEINRILEQRPDLDIDW